MDGGMDSVYENGKHSLKMICAWPQLCMPAFQCSSLACITDNRSQHLLNTEIDLGSMWCAINEMAIERKDLQCIRSEMRSVYWRIAVFIVIIASIRKSIASHVPIYRLNGIQTKPEVGGSANTCIDCNNHFVRLRRGRIFDDIVYWIHLPPLCQFRSFVFLLLVSSDVNKGNKLA